MELVKFKTDKEGNLFSMGKVQGEWIPAEDRNKTHLVSKMGDGETTACGQVYTDYDLEESGNTITCKSCIDLIKYYKSIKL